MHSHFAPVSATTVATALHEGPFTAVAAANNVMGTQFHPEKSRHAGATLLSNFVQGIQHGI